MTVKELVEKSGYRVIHVAEDAGEAEAGRPYCCDLLSVAMSKVPAGAVWVTVMSNLNTLAVASLTEAACVVIAEGVQVDEAMAKKAQEQEITLLATELPVFDAALEVYRGFA